MSEHTQTETQLPIYFSYGDDLTTKPQEGVLSVASVLEVLADATDNEDIMCNITNEGREGIYFIFKACQRQLNAMAALVESNQKQEPETSNATAIYPKLQQPMVHRNKFDELEAKEVQLLVNLARGHGLENSAIAIGVDNGELTKMTVRLEKRGLIEKHVIDKKYPSIDVNPNAESA